MANTIAGPGSISGSGNIMGQASGGGAINPFSMSDLSYPAGADFIPQYGPGGDALVVGMFGNTFTANDIAYFTAIPVNATFTVSGTPGTLTLTKTAEPVVQEDQPFYMFVNYVSGIQAFYTPWTITY